MKLTYFITPFLLSFLLLGCQRGPFANIDVQLGINQEQKAPDQFTRFDTRDIENMTFLVGNEIHIIYNFFATANLSQYHTVEVTLSLPFDDDLLVMFQFGFNQPQLRIDNNKRLYDFVFGINDNKAFIFTLIPLQSIEIKMTLSSKHNLLGAGETSLPIINVVEADE